MHKDQKSARTRITEHSIFQYCKVTKLTNPNVINSLTMLRNVCSIDLTAISAVPHLLIKNDGHILNGEFSNY